MNNLLLAYKRNHPVMKQKHNSKEKLSGTYHNPMMYVAMTLSTKNLQQWILNSEQLIKASCHFK
jgi:hypothetical protein